MAVEAYCVKCKAKREIKDPKQVTLKNGRNATEGVCPVCGTKLFRMGGGSAGTDGGHSGEKASASKEKAGTTKSGGSKGTSRSKKQTA